MHGRLVLSVWDVGPVPSPGTIAHYVAADGSHGVVINEIDDAAVAYKSIPSFTEWIDYQTVPVLTIEEAVPHILETLG